MTNNTKQEELPIRNRIVNCFSGNSIVANSAIDNLEKLINSQVLEAITKIKSRGTPDMVITELGDGASVVREGVVPLSAIEAIEKEYK